MNKKTKSELYDILYDLGDKAFKLHNPCQHDEHGICNKYRSEHNFLTLGCCCHDCKYLKSKGCSVKSLQCKLWYCSFITSHYSHLATYLDALKNVAKAVEINPPYIRMSKEDEGL